MVLDNKSRNYILNPFLYFKKFKDYSIIYVPYNHQIKITEDDQFFEKDKESLIKDRILVEEDYKNNFIQFYKKSIDIPPFLDLMYIILTDSCNFRCPYCFIENNYNCDDRKSMTWEIAKKGIDYFFSETKSKNPRIVFYGGEPTLNQEVLIKSIEYIREKNKLTRISINTNGSNYSELLSKIFKENNVNLAVSVDGFKPLHDRTRLNIENQGMYDLVRGNIGKYLKDGVKISFSITLNSYNIKYLPIVAKWIVCEFPEVKSIGFNLPSENIKGNPFFVESEYCALQLYTAFRIFRKYGIYEDRVMRRLDKIIENKIYMKDCAGCGNQIVLLPDGFVGPCHGFMGMKKDFSVKIENFNFKSDETIKKWNTYSPINKPNCVKDNCPFLLICGNGCPYYSYLTKGAMEAKDDRMLPFLSLLIEEMAKDMYFKMPKVVLIDYDSVLISRRSTLDILKFIANHIGYKGEIKPQSFYNIREIITTIAEKVKYKGNINDLIFLYSKLWKKDSKLNLPLLKQLSELKLPLYILTNNTSAELKEELGNYFGLFNNIFDKNSFDYKKPSKEFYELTFKTIRLKPQEVVYIGDNYKDDIKPILSLGIRTAISTYANNRYYEYTDNNWLIDIFSDLNRNE